MTTLIAKIFKVELRVMVPEDATHYAGRLWDEPMFFKCTQIGVVGDHWWYWEDFQKVWKFSGHYQPHELQRLPTPVNHAVQAP